MTELLEVSTPMNLRADSLTLVALPSAVWISRAYVAATLRGWNHGDAVVEDARIIVSELVTNSVNAWGFLNDRTRTGVILSSTSLLRIAFTELAEGELLIEVWDAHEGVPKQRAADVESTRGRGLAIVSALAKEWGYRCPRSGTGKVVWARLTMDCCPPWTGTSD
jgi:anti-sigma regulatory factor (Ser/Thr protein kinase)